MSAAPFVRRHIGPSLSDINEMVQSIGVSSLNQLIDETIPEDIRLRSYLDLPPARSEDAALRDLREIIERNELRSSLIGMGYANCRLPAVIRRNILENPGWYTAYTPYQAEIAQGRLEALLNFQTLVCDLTGMDISNASLLDESTAAAEAMTMAHAIKGGGAFFVADDCHPQTIGVLRTRAEPLGIRLIIGPVWDFTSESVFGALIQYPATDGVIHDLGPIIARVHGAGALAIVAAELLALALIKPPGEYGSDIVVGSSQRFGVSLGYGGPHAAFLATRDEYKRRMPGRLVGVSRDAEGRPALRLTLQTREQHIRREKATSNLCTAQVLLAVIASMYAVYHGPQGLKSIASSIHRKACQLAGALKDRDWAVHPGPFFDTIRVWLAGDSADHMLERANANGVNLRKLDAHAISLTLDETMDDLSALLPIFDLDAAALALKPIEVIGAGLKRESEFLRHPVFNSYHTETELLRYIRQLESRDLSLTTSMIPLGSCTMKLNAAAEMLPVTWEKVADVHPFAPADQARGYQELFRQLEKWFCEITGFAAVSLQPNAGSQGEYAGLLVIRAYHHSLGHVDRNICLIPTSAHGTNPASAIMAGMRVVTIACDSSGNIDRCDLDAKISAHRKDL
ncbi:MAG TPA: aminomethyl-transferring glycine dehydrogenase, partial [Terrimicrobiaceae bacterium]